MLLNTVLKQISNLLIIALRLALHWQFHAGFAGGASSWRGWKGCAPWGMFAVWV